MSLTEQTKSALASLLTHELLLSQGCTEPAAIAYAGALCREYLGILPERVRLSCSGNLFKNAKSAIIPNTEGLKGLAAAMIAGVVGGDASLQLQVLSTVTSEHLRLIRCLLHSDYCSVQLLDSSDNLHIVAEALCQDQSVSVEICRAHTNVVKITRNHAVLFEAAPSLSCQDDEDPDIAAFLTPRNICAFADTADLSGELGDLLRGQLSCNVAICKEGMQNDWGACIGKLIASGTEDLEKRACAFAAAGSDARMSGCPMPVVINSGSGNQGITVTAPVYIYAEALHASEDALLRALIVSNLMAIHQKRMIGKLSAYCGAVSAGCGAGAAITYLKGGSAEQVAYTFANAAACVSGILCDGAKPSCAAKIACAVQAGILGHKMAMEHHNLLFGDGIVGSSPEETIQAVANLAKEGLAEIDKMILHQMYSSISASVSTQS